MSQADHERNNKIELIDAIISHFVYGLIKVSVVLFYKRIFITRRFNICANIVLGLISIFMIVSFFLILFCARGVSSFWTTPVRLSGTELILDFGQLLIALAGTDICLDLIVLSMPLFVIKSLHMSRQKKLYVSATFLLGAFCLVTSVVRLYYTHILFGLTAPTFTQIQENALWGHIESYASIIASCLPTLAPFVHGGRNLDSVIGSVRSIFSVRSRSLGSLHKSSSRAPSSESSKGAWYELQSKNGQTTATASKAMEDVEAQSHNSDVIMVHQSFASGTQPVNHP